MTAADLIAPWAEPYGGVPPFDRATPALIEEAVRLAVAEKRREIAAIVADPKPASFANTLEALEDSGRALRRAQTLRHAFASTRMGDGMAEVESRLSPLLAALEDEIWGDPALLARVEAVRGGDEPLAPDQRRLADVIHARMRRRGAHLPSHTRAELKQVNGAIAAAQARFQRNLNDANRDGPVWVDDPAELDGVPEETVAGAAALARSLGRPDAWAIGATRPSVWAVLQHGANRDLRQRVRDLWMERGARSDAIDNRALVAEIATLRGQQARLLGFANFAEAATAARMAGTPQAALDQLLATWTPVLAATRARQAELEALAAEDGIDRLEPWDWLYYMARLRRERLGVDGEAVRPYLALENVLAALFDAMGRLHGLAFTERPGVPTIHPDVRTFEVSRDGEVLGLIYLDLLFRDGKMRGSWQAELRPAESFRGRVIPLSNVCSNFERDGEGRVLLGLEAANVLFHEAGHALHMLMSRARYPSLGPMGVEWDLVELPSQLNERWLFDPALLRRHMRHVDTGEPMPEAMIDGLQAALAFDRVFSLGVEYLAPAIVDLRVYMAADGSPVDPVAIEKAVYAELGMPHAVDAVFRITNQYHSFTDAYAAGVYVYLWADVMVADVIEAFLEAPGGLYDADIAARWRETVLGAGSAAPGAEAFRAFRGRDPDPQALLRRFALA